MVIKDNKTEIMKTIFYNYLRKKTLIIFSVIFLGSMNTYAGCNFGITNESHVSNTYTFTIGQGPWGQRQYVWNFGDGSSNGLSYSTPNNTTEIVHTFPSLGVYTMTISSQDSLGGGCQSWITYSVNVTSDTVYSCQASFSYITDSVNCSINFISNSTGSNLTYSWYDVTNNNYVFLGSDPQFSASLTYGYHTITLYTYSNYQFCDSLTQQVYASCNGTGTPISCSANISASPSSSGTSNCWQFNNFSTGNNLLYSWNFGDGGTSSAISPIHCYTDGINSHQVTLIIYGSNNCQDSTMLTVYDSINNPSTNSCHALFTYWSDSSNCNTYFYNLSNNSTSAEWYINGNYFSNQINPVLTYTVPSPYYITLYSFDNGALCDTLTQTVYNSGNCYGTSAGGGNNVCHASFVLYNDSLNTHTYFAYDQSSGLNLTYFWDFGDGNTSTQQYPTHTYNQPGNYIVCLTVSGADSCTSQYCDSNNVQKIAASHFMQTLIVKPSMSVTGVKEVKESINISLYPNPATDLVSIEADVKMEKIILMDITGKQVLQVEDLDTRQYQLSVLQVEKGAYFIQIYSKSGYKTVKKVVKL